MLVPDTAIFPGGIFVVAKANNRRRCAEEGDGKPQEGVMVKVDMG